MGIPSQIFILIILTTCREPGVITWVQFLEGLPPKIWESQKSPNFFTISDNFRLWSRISPERVHKSKIEKGVDQLRPLPRWAKKFLNFGPQTKKLLTWVLTNRSAHFSGDCIFALKGGCDLKFLHTLEIDQGYLAHTPMGWVSPQKKFNRENLKFGLKFSVYTSISSELMGISSQSFIEITCREPGVITWVQFLEGLPSKIWEGKKTVQNFSQFWQLSTLNANISGADP